MFSVVTLRLLTFLNESGKDFLFFLLRFVVDCSTCAQRAADVNGSMFLLWYEPGSVVRELVFGLLGRLKAVGYFIYQ